MVMKKKNKLEQVMFKQWIVIAVGSFVLLLFNKFLGIFSVLLFILAAIMKIELEVIKIGSSR